MKSLSGIIGIFIALTLVGTGCRKAVEYKNAEVGVSFKFPDKWEKFYLADRGTLDGLVGVRDVDNRSRIQLALLKKEGSLNIAIDPAFSSLDSWAGQALSGIIEHQAARQKNYRVLQKGPVMFSGIPGAELVDVRTNEEGIEMWSRSFVPAGHTPYALLFIQMGTTVNLETLWGKEFREIQENWSWTKAK